MQQRDEVARRPDDAEAPEACALNDRDTKAGGAPAGASAVGAGGAPVATPEDRSAGEPGKQESGPGGPPPQPSPRSGWLLAVCCVAQFMVILDLSIVNVALPSIQSSLGFSSADLQWVVDAYAITFAG